MPKVLAHSPRPWSPRAHAGVECLSDLLSRESLSPARILAYAEGVARDLSFIHQRGDSHGAVGTDSILVFGDHARLLPGGTALPGGQVVDVAQFGEIVRAMLRACRLTSGDPVAARELRAALERIAAIHLPADAESRTSDIHKVLASLRLLRMRATRAALAAQRTPKPGPSRQGPSLWRWLESCLAAIRPHFHTPRRSLAYSAIVILSIVPLGSKTSVLPARVAPLAVPAPAAAAVPGVWLVEHSAQADLYSNGLRIENRWQVRTSARAYFQAGELRRDPAGIIFHTTESDQVPFDASQNRSLQRVAEDVLRYVRDKRAYHFVIDRFGRVNRIVAESDFANHAGHSLWADAHGSFRDLNSAFLAVAFEARMQSGQPLTEAQVHAAKVLVEMLRGRYGIASEDCVTHAQVSLNPGNMRIGYHTDWGRDFPFQAIGLPDNYTLPNPGMYLYGFDYDSDYLAATGPALWQGLHEASRQLSVAAAQEGITVPVYRRILQHRYRQSAARTLPARR